MLSRFLSSVAQESFKLRSVILLYKAQAVLIYIGYSAKETFFTKHPYQRTVGKLRFNKRGKCKFFWLVVMYLWTHLNALKFLAFLVKFGKCVAKLSWLSNVTPNNFSYIVFSRIWSPGTRLVCNGSSTPNNINSGFFLGYEPWSYCKTI